MVTIKATVARATFSDLVNRVRYGSERVLIEKGGKPAVALISVEDFHVLEMLEDQLDIDAARKALANPKNRVRMPLAEVKKELGL